MIEVKVLRESGKLTGYEISGHAEFDEPGQDIVCAAVSALAQTGIYSLTRLVSIEFEQEIDTGFLRCKVSQNLSTKEREVELVINTIILGIYETARAYPGRIKIFDERGLYQCL